MIDTRDLVAADRKQWGTVALMAGVNLRNEKLVRQAIALGADLECMNSRALTPLMIAAMHGDLGSVRALVDAGAQVSCDNCYMSPLTMTYGVGVEHGRFTISVHEEVLEYLLSKGANPNHGCGRRRPMLYNAIMADRLDIARLLISYGAHPGCSDRDDWPILSAAQSREALHLLMDHGASLAERGPKGDGVLVYLVAAGAPLEVVEEANRMGAAIIDDPQGEWCITVLALAHGKRDVVRWLLGRGAPVDCVDEHGDAPLHLAAEAGRADLVKLLLARKANKTLKNSSGMTPEDVARQKGAEEVVRLLSAP